MRTFNGTLDIYMASAGTGKLFPLGTKIYTPNGYKNIEDIKIGEDVLSRGGVCKVLNKYHQNSARIYKITFSDGTEIEACADHNWWVRDSTATRVQRKWIVMTTQQILDKGLRRNYGNPKWEIPLCEALHFSSKEVPIKPYTLGALLGDGYTKKKFCTLTTMDEEIISKVLDEGYTIKSTTFGNSGKATNYNLDVSFPKDWRHTSEQKFIPESYLYNDTDIRFKVLQGLLDTDGCVDLSIYRNGSGKKSPAINYCTVSEQLAKDVQFLVQSLGGTATISVCRSLYKGVEYKPHYNIRIFLPENYEKTVFSVPRKRDRLVNHQRRIHPRRKIVNIEYIGEKEGYCLSVDSEDHTYIAQECVVTHNTSCLLNIIDRYLKEGVPIDRIAFVTFTKKGAEVAQLRTAEKFGIPLDKLKNFRTIHSMAFRGNGASRELMMDYAKYKDFGDKAGYNFGTLGLNTQEGIDWNEMKDQQLVTIEQLYRNNRPYCETIMEDRVDYSDLVRYIQLYNRYKKTFGYVDFTDLLERYIEQGLYEDVDIVCLDEMQDSSLLQWKLVFQAFSNAKHVYVASDIKQAVFSYAGASPETILKLRGNQHMLETSYRVPSRILSFAQNIVSVMQLTDHSHCKASKEGGDLTEITCLDELTSMFDVNKSYFFLARNKKFFKDYIEWCTKNGLPYKIKGEPVFTSSEKIEFREGRTDMWEPEHLDFAKYCYSKGTFYQEPKINISTIHTVKGDEADIVVLMGDISKAVASQLEVDEDSEHRVFYVAVTRAREKLIIVQPQTRMYYPYIY